MKKSELRQIIKEEIQNVLSENIKGRFWKDDNYYTYDHLLPKGTGDNFTSQQAKMMIDAAKNDLQILKNKGKKGIIKKDDMNLPYLKIKENLTESQKVEIRKEMKILSQSAKKTLEEFIELARKKGYNV